MFRKSVFIMLFVCLLATISPVAMAAYPWDNQLEWSSGASPKDANWYNPANWNKEGTLPCPTDGTGPGPEFYCAILPNQPGPRITGNATCSMLSLNPWDPTSWGGQDCNVSVMDTALDVNFGTAVQINSWVDYDSYLGQSTLVSRAILNVYGGTVTTPSKVNATNMGGITVGGGGTTFGLAYGILNIYGGVVNVPRVAVYFGEIGLYGGTLRINTDPNFVLSASHPENKVKINGGTFILAGDQTASLNNSITSGHIVCERGTLRAPVYDAGPNTTTLVADVNYSTWNPQPANNATNVHYKTPDGNSITLSWQESILNNPNDVNHDVYFGTSFADVNTATKTSPQYMGSLSDPCDPCSYVVKDPNKFAVGTVYYWRVDEYSNSGSNFKKGIVWTFTTHDGKAYNPKPVNLGTALSEPLQLSWTAGDWTTVHRVFFGTTGPSVTNASTSSTDGRYRGTVSSPAYPLVRLLENGPNPPGASWVLQAGVTYYWRIDEVNNTTVWKGPTWSFTPAGYINIDDFEDYQSTVDVNANWPGHYPVTGCTDLFGDAGRILIRDSSGKYLRYTYMNDGSNIVVFSEAKRPYSGGTSFTGGGVISPAPKALRIDYRGNATNDANYIDAYGNDLDRMYVAIEDTAGNVAVYQNPDPYAQQAGNWTSWYTKLTDINSLGTPNPVNLEAITGFAIGFGVRCLESRSGGGDGNVMFDNIRLYAATCVPGKGPTADLNGDCYVDINDLDLLVNDWLQHADNFVFTPCTQPAKAPILWYKFNESGETLNPIDSGTGDANAYTGTVTNWIASNWKPNGRDGNHVNCLYLPPGGGCYVNAPVTAPLNVLGFIGDATHNTVGGGGISFSVWVNADMTSSNMQTSWNGLFGIWTGTPQFEALELECPIPFMPANNYSPASNFVKKTSALTTTLGTGLRPSGDFGGRWNHWAFVKEPSSMKIYINGTLVASRDANGLTGDPNVGVYGPLCADPNVTAFRIGTRGGNWGMWNGYIQDFQMYDYALSAGEAAWLATDGSGHVFLPLVSPANINTNGSVDPLHDINQIVNFGDLAIMGKQWHTTILWP